MNATPTRRGRGRPRLPEQQRQPATVQALDRGLALFSLVAHDGRATLTELAASAGMAPSTAHRMLETLRLHDLVAFDADTQTWTVGVEAFRIGHVYAHHAGHLEVGRMVMRRLAERSGETANIAVIEKGAVVYVSQIESEAPIRAFFPAGSRGVVRASGIGKALLAYMDEVRRRELLGASDAVAFTRNTVTDEGRLRAELEGIRNRGWAIDDEERYLGMRCVAAPIFNEYGEPVAGLSISGPSARLPDAELERQGPLVRAAADEITDGIGGQAPGAVPSGTR